MASDEVTICHVLELLDRLSSKTLDYAVLQFKDHTRRFHESLSELKSLKLPTGEGILNDFAHPPLNPGGDLLNAPFSQSVQAHLKPPLNSTVAQEGIENYGSKDYALQSRIKCTPSKPPLNSTVIQEVIDSKQYALQSHVKCTPSKPPLNSTVVQEGVENYGSKKYTLRSRAPRKLSTTNAPQRITRSRAKRPVAAGTAAACNTSPKTEFTVLEDDVVKARSKKDREPRQHQQVSCQGGFPTEAAVSDCKRAAEACHNQPSSCEKKLSTPTSIQLSKTSAKERSGLKDAALDMNSTEQFCLLSPEYSQHNVPQNVNISAAAVSDCKRTFSNQSPGRHKLQLHDTEAATASVATEGCHKHPSSCEKKLSTPASIQLFKTSAKERSGLKDAALGMNPTEQFRLLSPEYSQHNVPSKMSILATPCQSIPKCDCGEAPILGASGGLSSRAQSIKTGVVTLPKSPTICIPTKQDSTPPGASGGLSLRAQSINTGVAALPESPMAILPKSPIICIPPITPAEQGRSPRGASDGLSSRAQLINAGVASLPNSPMATLPKSPTPKSSTICVPSLTLAEESLNEANNASQCKLKLDRQFFVSAKDGPFLVSPKKCDAFEFHVTPSIQKQSPRLTTQSYHGTDIGHSVSSRKRKLSVYGVSANAQCTAKQRISLSYDSPLYEAFVIDDIMVQSPWGDQSTTFFEMLNTTRIKDCVEQKEGSHKFNGLVQKDIASGMVLEGPSENLSQAHGEVAVSGNLVQKSSSPKGEEASDTKMAGSVPRVKETENCVWEMKLEKPRSQVRESEFPWRPKLCQKSPSKRDSLGRLPSAVKNGSSIELPKHIPDVEKEGTDHETNNCDDISDTESQMDCNESPRPSCHTVKEDDANEGKLCENESPKEWRATKEGTHHETDNGDDISDTESQMDCSESPRPFHTVKEDDANEGNSCENESPKEWRATPKDDDGFLKFTELMAQGTVNSNRRKRARSPAMCAEESCKDLKRMRLLSTGKGEQLKEKGLPHALYSQSPTFGRNNSSMYGFPHLSAVRRFQDTFGMTFGDSPSKSIDKGDFHRLQRQIMGSGKLSKSYSRLPTQRKDYLDTPHFRSVRAGLVRRASIKASKQKSECHLITYLEDDGKENQSPETLNRDSNTSMLSDWQVSADTRKVLGYANHSLGPMESPHKCYNLAVGTGSFLDLVQQKQLPLPHPNGRRVVRMKALEAAEHARKQGEQREIERKRRRLECIGVKGVDSDSATDKLQRVTDKVKRVAELKIKMDQEKARKQELEQRKKEEERKKKEAELADKKRKREDADKRDREEKRKRVEEVQRLRKEQEERQRVELNEKEFKRRMLEERDRERKAQEEEAKRQRRLEKEKEAERRRKQDEHLKAARFAEKQAERKRKEAMLLQAHGNEDDDFIAQIPLGNKLSFLSTESFAVSTSNDWEAQSKSVLRTRSQTSGDKGGLRVPSLGTSAYCQNNNEKLTSLGENGPFLSTKQAISGLDVKCEPFKSLNYTTPSNTRADVYAPTQIVPPENEIQSYEISPYKSSSDDEDDDQPKKPVPLWAKKEYLLQQLLWQQTVNPDRIFSSAKTCSLAEIFGTTGSRRCKDFTKRSASGDWLDDHATWKEELDYKKAMGYM